VSYDDAMKFALVCLAIGCGSKAPPADQTIGHHVAPIAAASCADVGVILRGPVDGGEDAGRAREAAIANACTTDKWDAAVVACVASEKKPQPCLAKLSEKQRVSYSDKLEAWQGQYGGSEYGGANDGADDPPPPPEVACDEVLATTDRWFPLSAAKGPDVELAKAMRTSALNGLCDGDGWDQEVLECIQVANDSGRTDPTTCVIDATQRAHVTAKLADIDALVAKLDGARKKKPDCKKAVTAHYADATWKGKLDYIKGKDRTKMITDSRTTMTKACTSEKWDDTTRACLVVGGGNDCFVPATKRWGFPAQGVIVATGIPECDAWGAEVGKLLACDKLPQASRDAVQQAYEQANQMWANVAQDQRAAMADACKSVTDAVKQLRTSTGCP
jgi:hypothetical protein